MDAGEDQVGGGQVGTGDVEHVGGRLLEEDVGVVVDHPRRDPGDQRLVPVGVDSVEADPAEWNPPRPKSALLAPSADKEDKADKGDKTDKATDRGLPTKPSDDRDKPASPGAGSKPSSNGQDKDRDRQGPSNTGSGSKPSSSPPKDRDRHGGGSGGTPRGGKPSGGAPSGGASGSGGRRSP